MDILDAHTLGKIIKDYRKCAGLTQFQLADLIEIDDKQLGKIERGVHYPSVATFLKLIKVLNIDIKSFYKDSSLDENVPQLLKLIANLSSKQADMAHKILETITQY